MLPQTTLKTDDFGFCMAVQEVLFAALAQVEGYLHELFFYTARQRGQVLLDDRLNLLLLMLPTKVKTKLPGLLKSSWYISMARS